MVYRLPTYYVHKAWGPSFANGELIKLVKEKPWLFEREDRHFNRIMTLTELRQVYRLRKQTREGAERFG